MSALLERCFVFGVELIWFYFGCSGGEMERKLIGNSSRGRLCVI